MDYVKCQEAFVSSRLSANGIISEKAKGPEPKVAVLDDVAMLSVVASAQKDNKYDLHELNRLKFLSARYPYIIIKEKYIRALLQYKDVKTAYVIYNGTMNCYGKKGKKYLRDLVYSDPQLADLKNQL